MHVLKVVDVNEALPRGLAYLRDCGNPEHTRNGPALVAPGPVATVYLAPQRRVLLDPKRDANPFFHLFEALWIIGGRADVAFLTMFNARMADYSDNGHTFHAPYGFRLRNGGGMLDQVSVACDMLASNPTTRRAVLQIWDCVQDLNTNSKDLPCNDLIFLTVREQEAQRHVLDITVCNRSNDVIWGAYGANVVQFSMLQEYMAAKIGVGVGQYVQFSHNYHVYTDTPYWTEFKKLHPAGIFVPGSWYDLPVGMGAVEPFPLADDPYGAQLFDSDSAVMFEAFDLHANVYENKQRLAVFAERMWYAEADGRFRSSYFQKVVLPMLHLYVNRNKEHPEWNDCIDWIAAGTEWVQRRLDKEKA